MMSSGSKGKGQHAPRLALDTSAYSRLRAGDERVHDAIAAAEVVLMPATVLGELWGAFEMGSRSRENRVMLTEFLDEPFVGVIPVSVNVARQYGRVYAALRRAGTPIPVNDMWIAAAVIDQGACLLTFDQDFQRVAGLEQILLEGIQPGTEG
jgi:predicted nucleic acid-binding protein